MTEPAPFLGIDFGTSKSSAAWFDPETGRAELLWNAEGNQETPSVSPRKRSGNTRPENPWDGSTPGESETPILAGQCSSGRASWITQRR